MFGDIRNYSNCQTIEKSYFSGKNYKFWNFPKHTPGDWHEDDAYQIQSVRGGDDWWQHKLLQVTNYGKSYFFGEKGKIPEFSEIKTQGNFVKKLRNFFLAAYDSEKVLKSELVRCVNERRWRWRYRPFSKLRKKLSNKNLDMHVFAGHLVALDLASNQIPGR